MKHSSSFHTGSKPVKEMFPMKAVERIIVKLIIIQALFLGFVQVLLSLEDNMIPLTKLSQYEGVNSNNYTKIIETFEGVSE